MIKPSRYDQYLRQFCIYTIGFIFCVMIFSGCEPLRKKFTRKKKAEKTQEVIPVLDPVDYGPGIEDPRQRYALHYGLWKVWQKDFTQQMNGRQISTKKQIYLLIQMKEQLLEMKKSVPAEQLDEFELLFGELNDVLSEYDQPENLRNEDAILRKVQRNGRKIREQFSTDKIFPQQE